MFSSFELRDRIVASRAFRRLAGKTQVVHAPESDHVATRLTHTLEVAAIARRLARGLGQAHVLDLDLVDAIALAHDVGHPPFGHAGEAVLARLAADAGLGGFHHAAFGVRLLGTLERADDGAPVASDRALLDGVLAHSKGKSGSVFVTRSSAAAPSAMRAIEARIVRAADLYAYASGDLDDAYRLSVLSPQALPPRARRVLGERGAAVREALVRRTITATLASSDATLALDEEAAEALAELRAHLYERFYEGRATSAQSSLARRVIHACWRRFERGGAAALDAAGWSRREHVGAPTLRDGLDALACMTDRFAIDFAKEADNASSCAVGAARQLLVEGAGATDSIGG